MLLGIGAPMLGVVLTARLVRRRGTPVEVDQDALERRLARIRR
jgi:hypothetical protein